jgi:hypothetical protein
LPIPIHASVPVYGKLILDVEVTYGDIAHHVISLVIGSREDEFLHWLDAKDIPEPTRIKTSILNATLFNFIIDNPLLLMIFYI